MYLCGREWEAYHDGFAVGDHPVGQRPAEAGGGGNEEESDEAQKHDGRGLRSDAGALMRERASQVGELVGERRRLALSRGVGFVGERRLCVPTHAFSGSW